MPFGYNPNKPREEFDANRENKKPDEVVYRAFSPLKKPDAPKTLSDAAHVINPGPRRFVDKDPYANEKPRTWTCDEHKVSGIAEGDECPKCKKERERIEREQEKERRRNKKSA